MKLKGIITNRYLSSWPSFDLVYEWEDCISKSLSIPLIPKSGNKDRIRNLVTKYRLTKPYQWIKKHFFSSQNYYLYYILGVANHSQAPLFTRKKVIPVIIDFFVSQEYLPRFYENYKEYELVLIADLDAYRFLQANHPPFRIAHFPLSLSDKYCLTPETHFEKRYPLLLAGRDNPVLNDFLSAYVAKHPDFEYVYRKYEDGRFNYYSNQTGLIGEFATREEFMNLIRASRCAFYATPGIDGDEGRTEGFSPLTPRFLEFLAAQCRVVARYVDNAEAAFYELLSITPNIADYQQFEKILTEYLQPKTDFSDYMLYLSKHYTSERIERLKHIVNAKA
ncbi:MAG: glycosyltransferase family 1 protein [Dysgonamonadaceae bacterium]|jgi:hypothetical protein|nr:glycosyltransferase family 1 protein [Dysgonamonadaceae bacterium]